jgi:hypothetical protein
MRPVGYGCRRSRGDMDTFSFRAQVVAPVFVPVTVAG